MIEKKVPLLAAYLLLHVVACVCVEGQSRTKHRTKKAQVLVAEGRHEAALTLALDLQRPGKMKQIIEDVALTGVDAAMARDAAAQGKHDVADAESKDTSESKGSGVAGRKRGAASHFHIGPWRSLRA